MSEYNKINFLFGTFGCLIGLMTGLTISNNLTDIFSLYIVLGFCVIAFIGSILNFVGFILCLLKTNEKKGI